MGGGDCFVKGTLIQMADGESKNIEEVKIGDDVLSYDTFNGKFEAQKVTGTMSQLHTGIGDDYTIKIKFGNVENHNTNTHPYYIKGKGWSSFEPELTYERYGLRVDQIEKGDTAFYFSYDGISEIEIDNIEVIRDEVVTYNLSEVSKHHNFFANSILVHNKGGDGAAPGTEGNSGMSPGSQGNAGIGIGGGSGAAPGTEGNSGQSPGSQGNAGIGGGGSGAAPGTEGNSGVSPGASSSSASTGDMGTGQGSSFDGAAPGTEGNSGVSPGTAGNQGSTGTPNGPAPGTEGNIGMSPGTAGNLGMGLDPGDSGTTIALNMAKGFISQGLLGLATGLLGSNFGDSMSDGDLGQGDNGGGTGSGQGDNGGGGFGGNGDGSGPGANGPDGPDQYTPPPSVPNTLKAAKAEPRNTFSQGVQDTLNLTGIETPEEIRRQVQERLKAEQRRRQGMLASRKTGDLGSLFSLTPSLKSMFNWKE